MKFYTIFVSTVLSTALSTMSFANPTQAISGGISVDNKSDWNVDIEVLSLSDPRDLSNAFSAIYQIPPNDYHLNMNNIHMDRRYLLMKITLEQRNRTDLPTPPATKWCSEYIDENFVSMKFPEAYANPQDYYTSPEYENNNKAISPEDTLNVHVSQIGNTPTVTCEVVKRTPEK